MATKGHRRAFFTAASLAWYRTQRPPYMLDARYDGIELTFFVQRSSEGKLWGLCIKHGLSLWQEQGYLYLQDSSSSDAGSTCAEHLRKSKVSKLNFMIRPQLLFPWNFVPMINSYTVRFVHNNFHQCFLSIFQQFASIMHEI